MPNTPKPKKLKNDMSERIMISLGEVVARLAREKEQAEAEEGASPERDEDAKHE